MQQQQPKAAVANATTHADARFWAWVGTTVDQLEGLVAGYNAAATADRALSLGDFLLLNGDGDVESLASALDTSSSSSNVNITPHGCRRHRLRHLRCSALWKLADDNSDVFFGHTTWDHFDMMLRTLKRYAWGGGGGADDVIVTMSSSPGFLSSVDDFYLSSRGLAVIETTNGNLNPALWDLLTPSSVLSWVRANVANAAAASAREWTTLFSMENSGTYNNQWMVLDMNRFKSGSPLEDGTFLILEQIPGSCVVEDKSAHLNAHRYWGSYNVPAIPSVWDKSGFAKASRTRPAWQLSHENCPRAGYLRTLNATVQDLAGFRRAIRWNKGPPAAAGTATDHDVYAGYGVSARFDLVPMANENFGLSGGMDGKASSVRLAQSGLQFFAQNGPTHDDVRPFDWRRVKFPNPEYKTPPTHEGMPDAWAFPWVTF